MDKIAKRIKDTIEDSNYNQTQIAEELEVSRRQIQRWINADQEMGIYKLKKLCQLSGISADYILGLPKGMKYPRQERR